MWLFTIYGFYSIACASKPDGSLDPATVMIRARSSQNLQRRFPTLAGAEIVVLANRDYRYRLIVPKGVWVAVASELAEEQEWSNFKHKAAQQQGKRGNEYTDALHDVWGIMNRLQHS